MEICFSRFLSPYYSWILDDRKFYSQVYGSSVFDSSICRFVDRNGAIEGEKEGKKCLPHSSPGFVLRSIHSRHSPLRFLRCPQLCINLTLITFVMQRTQWVCYSVVICLDIDALAAPTDNIQLNAQCLVGLTVSEPYRLFAEVWTPKRFAKYIWNAFSRTFDARHGTPWFIRTAEQTERLPWNWDFK